MVKLASEGLLKSLRLRYDYAVVVLAQDAIKAALNDYRIKNKTADEADDTNVKASN